MISLEQDQEQFDKDEVEVIVKLVKTAETKRARETRIKNVLVLTTQAHEVMAASFGELHLRAESKVLFPHSDS